jgi:hypothetical protein
LEILNLEGNDVLGSLDLCVAVDANGVGNVYNVHCLVLNEISAHHNKACGYFNMTCIIVPFSGLANFILFLKCQIFKKNNVASC